jgi:DNA-binding NarL/FixJ family response regulator
VGRVRILLAEDHEAMRRALRTILSARPDLEICGEAADGLEVLAKTRELKPDVVLLDISMPHVNGLDACRQIHQELPQAAILILSEHEAAHGSAVAREAGAHAFVAKSGLPQALFSTLEAIIRERPTTDSVPA